MISAGWPDAAAGAFRRLAVPGGSVLAPGGQGSTGPGVYAAVDPIKQRDRGIGAGEMLSGIAAAQLAREDFLAGLDWQRADATGQQITPVPGPAAATAAGLARQITPVRWEAAERGLAVVTGRMLDSTTPSRKPTRPPRWPGRVDTRHGAALGRRHRRGADACAPVERLRCALRRG